MKALHFGEDLCILSLINWYNSRVLALIKLDCRDEGIVNPKISSMRKALNYKELA